MMNLSFPDLSFAVVPLNPGRVLMRESEGARTEERSGRFGRRDRRLHSTESVAGRLKLGGPLAAQITDTYADDDGDLLAFMADSGFGWRLIHSAVSFENDEGDPRFEGALLTLTLSGEAEAIAWSLLPESASTPLEISNGFTVSPELAFAGASASPGAVSHGKTRQGKDVYLSASGLMEDTVKWKFKRTKTVELDGSHRLVMVARGARGAKAQVTATLEGSVRTGRLPGPLRKTEKFGPSALPSVDLSF